MLGPLARDTRFLLNLPHELESYGVTLISLRESIDLGTPVGRAVLQILGSIAELEKNLISERIKAALAVKKMSAARTGWRCGRKPIPEEIANKALERKMKSEVKYVNDEDFDKILNHVRPYHNKKFNQTASTDVLKDFYKVCYASGARQSGVFALRTESLKGNGIFIDSQIRRNEKFKTCTKTGKARRAIFFEEGIESLHRWSRFSGREWNVISASSTDMIECNTIKSD